MTTHGSVGCIPRASRYFYPCLDGDSPRPREHVTVIGALTLKRQFELDSRKLPRDLDELLSWTPSAGWIHRLPHLFAMYDVVGWRPLDRELDLYPQFGRLHDYPSVMPPRRPDRYSESRV